MGDRYGRRIDAPRLDWAIDIVFTGSGDRVHEHRSELMTSCVRAKPHKFPFVDYIKIKGVKFGRLDIGTTEFEFPSTSGIQRNNNITRY